MPSVTASSALSTATTLNEWMSRQENEVTVITFSKELYSGIFKRMHHAQWCFSKDSKEKNVAKFSHIACV